MSLAAAVVAVLLAVPLVAHAAPPPTPAGQISDVKTADGLLQFLFTATGLPPGSVLDPQSVAVQSGDETLPATASIGTATRTVAKPPLRESMVVLDTSGSMAGDGISAARQAALAYASSIPADVHLGLLTFSDQPHLVQAPTTSRGSFRRAVTSVTAGGSTALYDGLIAAVQAMHNTPNDSQRRILVLSDGADTTSTRSLADAVAAAQADKVAIDVVAFRLPGSHAVLDQIAAGTGGRVLAAENAADLGKTFASAAAAFQSRVLVTVQVPADLAGKVVDLVVSMHSQDQSIQATLKTTLPGTTNTQVGIGPKIIGTHATSTSKFGLWTILIITFVVILLAAMSVVWVPLDARAQRAAQARVAEIGRYRVLAVVGREQNMDAGQQSEGKLSKAALSIFDRLVRSRGNRQTIVDKLERAGLRMRPEEWLILQVAAVLVLAALVGVLSRNIFGVILGALAGYFASVVFLRFKTERRSRAFNEQLPDVLQLIAGSLRSGFSLNQAVAAVVREGTEPTASEIARALTEVRLGSDLEDALDRVAERMKCPDLHWVVMAVRISREVGGNLAEVLGNTVTTMRERAQIRGQIRILSAEGRISARILIALPFLVGGFLAVLRPSYLTPLFHTGIGIGIVIAGAILLVVGAFWITRIVKIEV